MNDQNRSPKFEDVNGIDNKVKRHEKKLTERLSYTDEIAFVVLLLVFGGAIIMSSGSGFPTEFFPGEEATATTSSEEQVSQDMQNSIEGDIIEVVVDDERAEPFRPRIAREDGVRFVNDASYELRFEFNRELETFTLEQGETREVNPTVIMYYTVNPVDESIEFREISGGINVQ